MKQIDNERFLGGLVDCFKLGDVAKEGVDVAGARSLALLQVAEVDVITEVLTGILADGTPVALFYELLLHQIKVEVALKPMASVFGRINAHVPGLVAALIRQAEVIDVFSNILKVKSLSAGSHTKVDYDVMLGLLATLHTSIDTLKSFVTVLNRACNDLSVRQGEL